MDSARKEKGPACQHPDSPIHESVSTVGPEAVGQAQKPHDTGHIASCTHGKAQKQHARTQGAFCSPCRTVSGAPGCCKHTGCSQGSDRNKYPPQHHSPYIEGRRHGIRGVKEGQKAKMGSLRAHLLKLPVAY